MRIGINGFGRIGRNYVKALLERRPDVEVAAVNDLISAEECAHLFKYDSNYGTFAGEVGHTADTIAVAAGRSRCWRSAIPVNFPGATWRRRRHRIDRHLHRRHEGPRPHRRRRRAPK